jgi:flagellar biosynthesis/type III secretory pathway M-ring protein FliF/YscJ
MEWFKKLLDSVTGAWSKWTMVQKIILGAIVVTVIVGIVLLVGGILFSQYGSSTDIAHNRSGSVGQYYQSAG